MGAGGATNVRKCQIESLSPKSLMVDILPARYREIDYYGVTFDPFVTTGDTDPEVLRLATAGR